MGPKIPLIYKNLSLIVDEDHERKGQVGYVWMMDNEVSESEKAEGKNRYHLKMLSDGNDLTIVDYWRDKDPEKFIKLSDVERMRKYAREFNKKRIRGLLEEKV